MVVMEVAATRDRVSYKDKLTEADIVDKALFHLVLQTLVAAGHPREEFFEAADELRVTVYRQLLGDDILRHQGALGIAHTQWHWMKAICQHFQVAWPGDSTEPRKYGKPADLAFTTMFLELRREEIKNLEMEDKTNGALSEHNDETPEPAVPQQDQFPPQESDGHLRDHSSFVTREYIDEASKRATQLTLLHEFIQEQEKLVERSVHEFNRLLYRERFELEDRPPIRVPRSFKRAAAAYVRASNAL